MRAPFRTLLIATNVERDPYPVYPVGAAMVARSLRDHGVEVTGVDFSFVENPLARAREALAAASPDLVGISLRAVDTTSSLDPRSYLQPVVELVAELRRHSSVPIVVGGAGYSLFPELLVERLGADFGVVGEGEATIRELVDRLHAGESPQGLPGLVTRGAEGVVCGPPPPPLAPASWSRPDLEVFPLDEHLAAGGMASVQSKRGCPLDCSYCTYPKLEGRGMRPRPPAEVAAEVAELAARGVDYYFFVDNNFNIPAEHGMAVCAELARLEERPEWTAFVTPNGFREEHAPQIAAAGARSLEFGSESGAPAVLDGLGKHHRADDIRRADHSCLEAGVTPAHYFIFGGPGETVATVEQSLELVAELRGPVVAMLGIRVYPHTRLHQRALAEGVVDPTDDLLAPSFYFSPQVDPEAVAERLQAFAAAHRTFILIGSENGLERELVARLRKHGRRGPLWEFMRR